MSKVKKFLILACIGLSCGGLLQLGLFQKLSQLQVFGTNIVQMMGASEAEEALFNGIPSDAVELYKREIVGKDLNVADYYQNELAMQEEALWQEIYTTTGLTYEVITQEKEKIDQYEERLSRRKKNKRSKSGGLSSEVASLALEVINDFGIESADLEIISGEGTSYGQRQLMICEDQLRCMPIEGARSVLAHEMIHYQLGDDSLRNAMVALLYKNKMDYKKFSSDHVFYKHMRFEESRADILSALKDSSYAQGAVEGLSVLLEDHGDRGFPSHPLTSERIKTVQQVVDLLSCEQQLNKI